MNIYVETNFVLELVFEQEQRASCEEILLLCETGHQHLIMPAYCIAEPHEKLIRQKNSRVELQNMLNSELRQLARSASYTARINSIQDVASILVQSIEEEKQRFAHYRDRLLKIAEIIPLTLESLTVASQYESAFNLTPQDALVFASVINHLQQLAPANSCFLNKNSRDFGNPGIIDMLDRNRCKMIPRFDQGYEFITAHSQS